MPGFKIAAGLATIAAVFFATAPASAADSVEQFYKGRQIRMVIASGAGGGYDTYARVVGHTIGTFIPGHPSVIPQNMDGASGLTATNFAYNIAQKDGTVLAATYNSLILQPLLGGAGVKYDSLKFNWIGSVSSQQNICVTWHTSAVKTLDDAKGKQVIVAATGAAGDSAQTPRMLNKLAGTNFKTVLGYSTSESRLALERGEAEGLCGLSWSTFKASSPEWLEDKKVNIITQMGLHKHPDMPDVPLAIDAVAGADDKQVLALLLTGSAIGRPFLAPPDVPAERVAALRAAFMATMKDRQFLAEADKAKLEVDPMGADEINRLIEKAYAAPKPIIERAAELVNFQR